MDKREILQRCYGYSDFRPGQEKLIDAVLAGRDVFGIMPTGGGKSICYQVPALLLPGITLVISPLISLMRDQVQALKAVGIPAAYINSTLTPAQLQAVYRNLRNGQYRIVYVAPERLDYGGFGALSEQISISFVAVDEAHCISQWGQDFRPSYLRIVQFIESLPVRPVVGAFTATATDQVRQDIERILKLRSPVRTVTGFDRPNLFFHVIHPEMKQQELLNLVEARRRKSGIIYCATRKKVESVCETLCDHGYAATRYHAGLEESERSINQEDFLHDRKTIMVATNAFGMGIDKSNVSYVIHYNMPKSIEAYYQEAGRAGRDGSDAECILLYNAGDFATAQYLVNNASDNEELDSRQREQIRKLDMARLEAMVGYCKTATCLRGYILEYFGQKHPEVCGNCGNCMGDFEKVDITREAQMILSCVKRAFDHLGHWPTLSEVAKILQGAGEPEIQKRGLDGLTTFGLLKNKGRREIRDMAGYLEEQGYLITDSENQSVRLTTQSSQVLYRNQTVQMLRRKETEAEIQAPKIAKLSGKETDLYEALLEFRGHLAKEKGIPAYVIFTNATLTDMARKRPKNLSQFRKVSGVGEITAAWYGKDFVNFIREFTRREP